MWLPLGGSSLPRAGHRFPGRISGDYFPPWLPRLLHLLGGSSLPRARYASPVASPQAAWLLPSPPLLPASRGVLLLPSVPSRLRRPFRRTPSARPPVRPCFSHPPPPPLPPACYQAPPCPTCPKRCSIPRTPIPCSALPRAPLPWGLLAPPVFPFTRRGAARPSYIPLNTMAHLRPTMGSAADP